MGPSQLAKAMAETAFNFNADEVGVVWAKIAADLRDLETENERLRLQLALLTEEG